MRASLRRRILFAMLALPAVPWRLSADPPRMAEREAREVGRRLVREGRFAEAIAAFAQSAKCWPGPTPGESRADARSELLENALEEVWTDLEERGAPDTDRLPYAEFYVAGFPFFSTCVDEHLARRWLEMSRFVAATRLRLADPPGSDPRFDRCRRLATLTAETGGGQALAWLEADDWPTPHEDFGSCALAAFPLLDAWVSRAGGAWQGERGERAWAAYARRFARERCFGWAAMGAYRPREAEAAATDPVALRWCRTMLVEQADEADGPAEPLARLAEVAGPWMTPALGEAWAVASRAGGTMDDPARRAATMAAWRRLKEKRAGSVEFGIASFAMLRDELEWSWHQRTGAQDDFLGEWAAAAPGDPFLAWARLVRICARLERDEEAALTGAERMWLEEIVERLATESIAASAQLVLAEDDVRRGQGDRALQRYEAVASFDPEGVSLPAAGHPRDAIGAARERLVQYWRSRDPGRIPSLSENPIFAESPHQSLDLICGNAVHSMEEDDRRMQAARLLEAGRIDQALDGYWKGLSSRGLNGGDAKSALAFADLCIEAGRRERLKAAIPALSRLQEEETREHPPSAQEGLSAMARLLVDYLEILDVSESEGAAGVAQRLAGRVRGIPWYALDRSAELDAVIHAARHSPRVAAEVPGLLCVPATPVSLLLAQIAPGPAAFAHAIDVYLALPCVQSAQTPDKRAALASGVLRADPPGALQAMLERVRTSGPAVWERLREVVAPMPYAVAWRVFRSCQDDPDRGVRDLVRMELEVMRRRRPWLAYCQEGK